MLYNRVPMGDFDFRKKEQTVSKATKTRELDTLTVEIR